MAKRQSRRGGNNQRFQRNSGAQRGANDVRRAAVTLESVETKMIGGAVMHPLGTTIIVVVAMIVEVGAGEGFEASEANKNNSSTSSMDGTARRRGQKTASIESQPK